MSAQKVSYKQERMMLPTRLAGVLRFRDMGLSECPPEILLSIDNLKIGKMVYNFKGTTSPPPPATNSWRSTRPGAHAGSSPSGTGGAGGGFRSNSSLHSNSWERPLAIRNTKEEENQGHRRYRGPPTTDSASPVGFPTGRYVSSLVAEKNVDERIIGHIRAKLNKFSHNNYDSVKSFLEQIMNSGEVEFLTEFMDLLFTKAASEEIFCALYSRLLSELCEKFPFLKGEISKIYSNFLAIFQEARDVPDQNSSDYKKFLESQEKKKYRQGYSHFLAEIYNKGLLPFDSMETTVSCILGSLSKLEKDETNTLLVEEYLVSLSKIVTTIDIAKSAPLPPFLVNMLDTLKRTIEKAKADTPGYTTKSRFKIMDIIEVLPN